MSVFDQNIRTPLRVPDPLRDHTTPDSGKLTWGGGTVALAGTNGIDAKLVHGDRYQLIEASQTEEFGRDLKQTVKKDKTVRIEGILKTTVEQGERRVVKGNRATAVENEDLLEVKQVYTITVKSGLYDLTVTGEHRTHIYGQEMKAVVGSSLHNEAESWIKYTGLKRWQYGGLNIGTYGVNIAAYGGTSSFAFAEHKIRGGQIQILGVDSKLEVVKTMCGGGDMKAAILKALTGGITNKMEGGGS
jgi:hypothetical protein